MGFLLVIYVLMLAYFVYVVISPVKAREFWLKYFSMGFREPWNDAWIEDDPQGYMWVSRITAVFGVVFLSVLIYLLVDTLLHRR